MSEHFNASYLEGRAPWDIGRAQAEFVRLAEAGKIRGRVVDLGCGSGENALHLAERGFEVWGVDFAPAAIDIARRKAEERRIDAQFVVADVLDLNAYADRFDTAIDSGCFHVLNDQERARYVRSVRGALRPAGRLFLACFSERQPGAWGPRRVTQAELRDAFSKGWRVDSINEAHFEVAPELVRDIEGRGGAAPGRIEAWLVEATRLP